MGMARYVDPDCGNPAFGTPIRAHWLAETAADDNIREVADWSDADFCARPDNFDRRGTLINNNVQQVIAFVRAEHSFSDALRVNASAITLSVFHRRIVAPQTPLRSAGENGGNLLDRARLSPLRDELGDPSLTEVKRAIDLEQEG